MGESTRKEALKKFARFSTKIGHPEKAKVTAFLDHVPTTSSAMSAATV